MKLRFISRWLIQIVIVVILSVVAVRKIGEPAYPVLFSVQAVLSVLCGFLLESKGAAVTEKIKTRFSVLSITVGTASIIFLILCGHFIGIIVPVLCHFAYCPLGAMTCALIRIIMD